MTDDPLAAAPEGAVDASDPDPAATMAGRRVASARGPDPTQSDPLVDGAVAGAAGLLAQLPERALPDHPDVYDQVHGELRRALADIDDA